MEIPPSLGAHIFLLFWAKSSYVVEGLFCFQTLIDALPFSASRSPGFGIYKLSVLEERTL